MSRSRTSSSTYPTTNSGAGYRSSTSISRRRFTNTPALSTTAGRKSQNASSIGGSEGHEILCAISEARGVTPSVGVAFVNISTGEANLTQICDTQFYVKTLHQVMVYNPCRILLVSTSFPPNPLSTLNSMLAQTYQHIDRVPLDRKYWSEQHGLEYLQTLAFRDEVEAIKVAIEGNFYATCAFSAVSPRTTGLHGPGHAQSLVVSCVSFPLTEDDLSRQCDTSTTSRQSDLLPILCASSTGPQRQP